MQKHAGTWYAVIDLANAFFIDPEQWDQFVFTQQGQQYTFTTLLQGYIHSPTIYHGIAAKHLDEVALPTGMQIIHYIDDNLLEGSDEEQVRTQLDVIIQPIKMKGWEINPEKIQGPRQSVKILGIIWNKGKQEILPKGKQKILELVPPQPKKQSQKFIGSFGFWRQHILHLRQILQSLYKVVRKKYNFEWGEAQKLAFEQAKIAIQTALDLWPIREGPMELQVSMDENYANWSLWQKQEGGRMLLGCWLQKIPNASTPSEKQLVACYWALIDTEAMTLYHEVQLRSNIPIITWVMSTPQTLRIDYAQESSIIK